MNRWSADGPYPNGEGDPLILLILGVALITLGCLVWFWWG